MMRIGWGMVCGMLALGDAESVLAKSPPKGPLAMAYVATTLQNTRALVEVTLRNNLPGLLRVRCCSAMIALPNGRRIASRSASDSLPLQTFASHVTTSVVLDFPSAPLRSSDTRVKDLHLTYVWEGEEYQIIVPLQYERRL